MRMRVREMLKVTECVRVNSFVRALINMVCELKITSECRNERRNKTRSEVTLLNWRSFRRDKLPLFMPGQD